MILGAIVTPVGTTATLMLARQWYITISVIHLSVGTMYTIYVFLATPVMLPPIDALFVAAAAAATSISALVVL